MKLFITSSQPESAVADAVASEIEALELRTAPTLDEALRIMTAEQFDCVIVEPAMLNDPQRRFRQVFETTQDPGCYLMLGVAPEEEVPIAVLNDEVDGCIDMPLQTPTLQALVRVCSQLDEALMQRRGELRQRDEEIATLVDISNIITANLEFVPLLAAIARATTKALGADRTTIFIYHPETQELEAAFAEGLGANAIVMPASVGISGHVAATRQLVNVEDAYNHPLFYPDIDKSTGYRTKTILSCPLISPDGELIGVAECLNKRQGRFTGADERLLSMLAPLFAIAIENALLYRDLQKQVRENERMTAEKIKSERLAMVGRMAHAVTREIADPMEEIVTHASHLGREDLTAQERNATSQAIERIVDHLVDLAQELLDFSREQVDLARDRYLIEDFMDRVATTVASYGVQDRFSMTTTIEPSRAIVVDLNRLVRAVVNVVAVLAELTEGPIPATLGPDKAGITLTLSPLPAEDVRRFMDIYDQPFAGSKDEYGIELKISVARRILNAHHSTVLRQPDGIRIRIPEPNTGG